MQGPASFVILEAQTVIISGPITNSGLFEYTGAAGPGATLNLAIVPPGATTDPFGNLLSGAAILIQGNAITEKSGIFRTAATAPLIQLDGPHNAYLQYNASSVLSETIAPAATTDGLGNTVQGGITSYLSQTFYANLKSGLLTFADTVNDAFSGGEIGLTTVATSDDSITMLSPLALSTDIQASLILQRAATPGPAHAIIGNADLSFSDTNSVSPSGGSRYHSKAGLPRVLGSLSGDTNDYGMAQIIQEVNGTLPQIIGSTSQVNVQGLSVTVAAHKYRIRGRLSCSMGLTAGPMGRLVVTGPAITQMEIGYWSAQNNPGAATLFTATQTAIGTLTVLCSVNQGAGSGYTTQFEGTITFSASGTMTLAAAESLITSVAWQINAASYWEVAPE